MPKYKLTKNTLWNEIIAETATSIWGEDCWDRIPIHEGNGRIVADGWIIGTSERELQDDGRILTIELSESNAGTWHDTDSPNGTASVREFYDNGQLKSRRHMPGRSVVENPDKDIPAYMEFYKSGCQRRISYYKNGVLHNPSDNVAADTEFYDETGTIAALAHFRDGKAIDLENGIPSVTLYNSDGVPTGGYLANRHDLLSSEDVQERYGRVRQQIAANLVSTETNVVALSGLSQNSGEKVKLAIGAGIP